MAQVREIAKQKMPDLNANDIEARLQHDRRLGPLDGRPGGGVTPWRTVKNSARRLANVDRDKAYALDEAVKLVKKNAANAAQIRRDHRNRDESRHRPAQGRPDGARHGCSCRTAPARSMRVAVFAKGDKADEAKTAGADIVGAEDLAEKIQAG